MHDFSNQVILITGAKGGLGTSVTQTFLAAGAMVVGSSKSIQDSDFANPRFAAIPADLTVAERAFPVEVSGALAALTMKLRLVGCLAE